MALPAHLKDGDKAWRWAEKNLDLSIDEDDERAAEIQREEYESLAHTYSNFAVRVWGRKSLLVYRMICVPTKGDIELDNLGKAWSAEPSGAGCYGGRPWGSTTKEVLVAGEVSPKDIDWEYGFNSFMYYGEQQWEVSMESDSSVLILEIDGERLDPPVLGNTGHAREEWRSKR
jgi:hypothetical protein